jgi:hypothetical protein
MCAKLQIHLCTFQPGQPFTVNCPVATTVDFGCFADPTGQSLNFGARTLQLALKLFY